MVAIGLRHLKRWAPQTPGLHRVDHPKLDQLPDRAAVSAQSTAAASAAAEDSLDAAAADNASASASDAASVTPEAAASDSPSDPALGPYIAISGQEIMG